MRQTEETRSDGEAGGRGRQLKMEGRRRGEERTSRGGREGGRAEGESELFPHQKASRGI